MMKLFCVVFVVVLAVCVLDVKARSECRGPADFRSCKNDECCVKSRNNRNGYECQERGDKVNDRCGGDYACSDCDKRLFCQPDRRNNGFQDKTGTCQRRG